MEDIREDTRDFTSLVVQLNDIIRRLDERLTIIERRVAAIKAEMKEIKENLE